MRASRVAMIVEDGIRLIASWTGPLEALRAAGATVTIVGPTSGRTVHRQKRGDAGVSYDVAAGSGSMKDFDASSSRRPEAPEQDAHDATRWSILARMSMDTTNRWPPSGRSISSHLVQ